MNGTVVMTYLKQKVEELVDDDTICVTPEMYEWMEATECAVIETEMGNLIAPYPLEDREERCDHFWQFVLAATGGSYLITQQAVN